MQGSPRTNVHRISTRTDIAPTEVRRLLHGDDFYLCRSKECKTDYREITPARRVLCVGAPLRLKIMIDVLFTDEARFTRDHVQYIKTSRPWTPENPKEVVQSNLRPRFSANVCSGILGSYVLDHVLSRDV